MSIFLAVIAKIVSVLALLISYVSTTASFFWSAHEPKMPESMLKNQLK